MRSVPSPCDSGPAGAAPYKPARSALPGKEANGSVHHRGRHRRPLAVALLRSARRAGPPASAPRVPRRSTGSPCSPCSNRTWATSWRNAWTARRGGHAPGGPGPAARRRPCPGAGSPRRAGRPATASPPWNPCWRTCWRRPDALAALDLLEASASPLPAPLLSIPLMAAAGRQLLDSVTAGQEGQVGQALRPAEPAAGRPATPAGTSRGRQPQPGAARAMLNVPVQEAPATSRHCCANAWPRNASTCSASSPSPRRAPGQRRRHPVAGEQPRSPGPGALARPDMPLHALDWHGMLRLALDGERPQLAERLLALAPKDCSRTCLPTSWPGMPAMPTPPAPMPCCAPAAGRHRRHLAVPGAGGTRRGPAGLERGAAAPGAGSHGNRGRGDRLDSPAPAGPQQADPARDPVRMTADLEEFDALRQQLEWDEQLDQACHLACLQHRLGLQDAPERPWTRHWRTGKPRRSTTLTNAPGTWRRWPKRPSPSTRRSRPPHCATACWNWAATAATSTPRCCAITSIRAVIHRPSPARPAQPDGPENPSPACARPSNACARKPRNGPMSCNKSCSMRWPTAPWEPAAALRAWRLKSPLHKAPCHRWNMTAV